MVNIEVPKHYTGSPSSFSGTPHLTINREATVDLDSSNAFEGLSLAIHNIWQALTIIKVQRSSWRYGSVHPLVPCQAPQPLMA